MNTDVPCDAPTNLVLRVSDPDHDIATQDDDLDKMTQDFDVDEFTQEVERETRALFQDAHNAGFYINEYTTKVAVLGDKLLQGLRKAAEKQQDHMEATALEQEAKKVSKAQQALKMLRKMVHLIARLQVKSGAAMASPILFGHMSLSKHRKWEVNVRRPVALIWKSWEATNGKF